MASRLRDLIRIVRTCKTAAEERAVVQKECAAIRLAFKEGKDKHRSRNMLKLLYIAMLGYATEFGQMEVVKLLAQREYSAKRVGYLTLAVLMDETHEVLTLAENHIKNDLVNSNPFVQSLALDVVANIAGEDMSRDVLHEVQSLIDASNVHLKKKACLAGVRIVRRVPEYAEVFLAKLEGAFAERNHGALLSSLTLVNECLVAPGGDEFIGRYRQNITAATRVLKQLVLSSHAMEHDVAGIADPFLQVKLIEFLRITGTGSEVASEAMNDVLAQVATNTDNTKNAGAAILYECVKTMNSINADDGLRTLGVNTVSKFLTAGRENNVRFVALATLLDVLRFDKDAVQKHQSTVIDCLKDPDVSIRKRALDLIVALVDESNVRVLVPDLLSYLDVCGDEVREDVTVRLCKVIETFYPSPEWRVQISMTLLRNSRQFAPEHFAINLIGFVSRSSEALLAEAARLSWDAISAPLEASMHMKHSLLLVACWCCGECSSAVAPSATSPDNLVSRIVEITTVDSQVVKQYALNCLIKLASKHQGCQAAIVKAFESFAVSLDVELQQRACEYISLSTQNADLLECVCEKMPPLPAEQQVVELKDELVSAGTGTASAPVPSMLGSSEPAPAPAPARNVIDDLFGGPAPTASAEIASVPKPVEPVTSTQNPMADIFGGPVAAAAPAPPQPTGCSFEAFNCPHFNVQISRNQPATRMPVTMAFRLNVAASGFSILVAVPKTCTVNVEPLPTPSGNAGDTLNQTLIVDYSGHPEGPRKLMLRVKVVYSIGGQEQSQLFDVMHEMA